MYNLFIHIPIFLCYIFSCFVTNIVGNYATNREYLYRNHTFILPDLIHENASIAPAIVHNIFIISSVLSIIALLYDTFKKKRLYLMDLYFLCFAAIYSLRALCIYVTYLPNSFYCEEYYSDNFITNIRSDFCGDLMYSGHTAHAELLLLLLNKIYTNNIIKV
jgi:hypothetical protein